ncbi:MAG: hypothetical protein C5B49_03005 [Bdellovibrio sp.]|nr:MAG: hypothetical protein C5B49_03005 [Bdellovibrio sp.]
MSMMDKPSFEIHRFPQFLLVRWVAPLTRPAMHGLMKSLSVEFKSGGSELLRFVAFDLQQKFELDDEFFKVCRGLLTYARQAGLRLVALNCTERTKTFLKVSGMARFIIAISAHQLNELHKPTAPTTPSGSERPQLLAKLWGKKVADLISQLAPESKGCTVVKDAHETPIPDLQPYQVWAFANLQIEGDNFFLSISVRQAGDMEIFKTCNTYPPSSVAVVPQNWLQEFVNIAVHKTLRELVDTGYTAACQSPGTVVPGQISALAVTPLNSCELEFQGVHFVCACTGISAENQLASVS